MTEKKTCAQELTRAGLSVIAACRLVSLPRTSFYRTNTDWKIKDTPVIEAIYAELELSPRAGFGNVFTGCDRKSTPLIINGFTGYIAGWA